MEAQAKHMGFVGNLQMMVGDLGSMEAVVIARMVVVAAAKKAFVEFVKTVSAEAVKMVFAATARMVSVPVD